MANETISVVIAAYNEAETIGEIVKKAAKMPNVKEVIVVDDGSTDRTSEMASQNGAIVIKHPYNIGNGASVRTGCERASGDIVVLMDGDGQHDPGEMGKLTRLIGEYDMVVAARTSEYESSPVRRLGNLALTKAATMVCNRKIEDLTSGYRAIKSDILKKFMHLFPTGYSYPTTITLSLLTSGYAVKYVKMDSISKREKGSSNIRIIKDGMFFLMTILRVMVLFDPLKIFLIPSVSITLFGVVWAISNIIFTRGIRATAVIFIIIGIFIFFFGILADQISNIRKELRR